MPPKPKNPFSFSNLLSPFTSAFKKPATTATADPTKASPFSIPTRTQASPTSIPRISAPQMTPMAPNMSTPTGPTFAPPPSFATKQAIPQVTAQKPTVAPPAAPAAPTVPTTPTGLTEGQALSIQNARGGERAPAAPPTPPTPPETETAVRSAEKAFIDASKLTSEEITTQEDLDKLQESTNKAFLNISDQPIPLGFVTGQLASVERRALALAEPLETKLSRLQAKRTSAIESSKFALDRADKAVERKAATAGEAAELAESTRRFDIEQGLAQDKFDEDVRQFGLNYAQTQQKLNAADAKADETGSDADIADSLQGKIDFITEIGSHSGLNSRVGPTGFARRSFAIADKFGAGQDFAGSVKQLTSQEFLDKLINVKSKGATFGALSDREGAALRGAATKIADWEIKDENFIGTGEWNVDEASFKRELDKLQDLAQKAFNRATGIEDPGDSDEDELRQLGYSEEQIQLIINS